MSLAEAATGPSRVDQPGLATWDPRRNPGASALGLRGPKFRASRICGFSVSEVLRLEVFRAIGV